MSYQHNPSDFHPSHLGSSQFDHHSLPNPSNQHASNHDLDSKTVEGTSTDVITRRLLERAFSSGAQESLPNAQSQARSEGQKLHSFQKPIDDWHNYGGERSRGNPESQAFSHSQGSSSYHPHTQEHGRGQAREHAQQNGYENHANSFLPAPVLRAVERKDQRLYPHEITDEDVRGAVKSLQAQSLEALNKKVSSDSKLRSDEGASFGSHAKPKSRDGKWDQRVPTSQRGVDVRSIRADFPALHQDINGHQLVWFDNGATTHKPISVIEAMTHFYACDYSNIHRAAHSLAARATDHYESARETVRDFINAESTKDIVFVRGTTEGINFIANTCKSFLSEGDEILLTEMEHHANIVPWQLVAEEKRARIRVIPIDDRGDVILDEYRRLLTPRTKLVSVTHASNTLGTIPPVEEMAHMAHRKGARFIVDGAQSIAHMPVDVQALGCDFFVFSGHKVFAPTGIGAVYVHPDMQDLLPPWKGGGNMIHRVSFDGTTFSDPPAKFEAGTPSIGDAVGLGAALRYVQQFDPAALLHHEHVLLDHATRRLESIQGVRTIGHSAHKVGVVSFVLDGYTTEQVGKELDRYGIAVRTGHHCAQPSLRHFGLESTVRPSFALYNTLEEIDRMAEVIHRMARKA